jgi:hypothetical protein
MPLPRGAVKLGETWTDEDKITYIPYVTLERSTTYRYAGPVDRDGRRLEAIDFEVETTATPGPDSPYKQMEMKVRGKIFFDAAGGFLVERSESDSRKLVRAMPEDETFEELNTLTTLSREEDGRAK